MASSPHLGKRIRVAVGSGHLSRCQNKDVTWKSFIARFQEPNRSPETLSQYLRLGQQEQSRLKAMPGWVVAGPCLTGNRSADTITERHCLSFDIDAGSWTILANVLDDLSPICDYEWVLHTTRKHTPDKPRWRLYALLSEPVSREEYEPVTRIIAALIDSTLDAIDPVSFRHSQLMYFPTLCVDGDYKYHHNAGKVINPRQVLDEFPHDWRDFSTLPFSADRQQAYRRSPKSEDPLSKRGIVGAFCRTYNCQEAIEEFLPDIYEPGDMTGAQPRYTFKLGEGANGAILYDDGLFLYSNHASDPAGGRNANAFDLVRIHKFGDLDEDTDTGKVAPDKWPSFKAASAWARDFKEVRTELLRDRVNVKDLFDSLPEEEDFKELETEKRQDLADEFFGQDYEKPWLEKVGLRPRQLKGSNREERANELIGRLEATNQGELIPNLKNVTEILIWDRRFWRTISKNDFNKRIVVRKDIDWGMPEYLHRYVVEDKINGDEWTDRHDAAARLILEAKKPWGLQITDRNLKDAITNVANAWTFHPIIDYLEGLEWDGKPRIATFLPDYLGMPDTIYSRETARLFFTACVARIYAPGHKWDFVPILSGEQEIAKSELMKALFSREWAGELTVDMASNKDAVEQMLGKWCLELPEISNMRRAEIERVKEFITLETDRVRLAYDRRMSSFPRQSVFVGTTNLDAYLKDPTGNRRFWPWPVSVPMLDFDRAAEERDQIWAEAHRLWRALCEKHGTATSLPLYLVGEARAQARVHQHNTREESDTTISAARVAQWLDTPVALSRLRDPTDEFDTEGDPQVIRVVTCAQEAYCGAHDLTAQDLVKGKSQSTVMGITMRELPGWEKTGKQRVFGQWGRCWEYQRLDISDEEIARGYRIMEGEGDDFF